MPIIRPMESGDLAAAAELEQICFSDPWSCSQLEDAVNSRLDTCFVYEDQGLLLGFGIIRILIDEGEIQRIAVHPSVRNKGIGRQLMDAMTSFAGARGVTAMTLEVRESNRGARRLYDSCGFKEEAVRRAYYRNPSEDAIIMWNRSV